MTEAIQTLNDADPKAAPKFRRRKEARPDEILDAALGLFVEQGFAKTRVEDIAKRAGVSKGAVYLYFPSKDALIEALVDRALGGMADEIGAALRAYNGHPRALLERFAGVVRHHLEQQDVIAVPKLIIHEAPSQPQLARIYGERVINKVMPDVIAMFTRAMDAGHIRRLDPEMLVRCMLGPIFLHIILCDIFGIVPERGVSLDLLFETPLSVFFAGIEPVKEA